ncbi:hypothetical protein GGH99_001149 [Coemansia sp. RSA 1285]|nr:hypothetical protein GGH99_001149 [Coemansia sp. RSA 1285]
MYEIELFHAPEPMQSKDDKKKHLVNIIHNECPSLTKGAKFQQTPFVPGGHAQTTFAFCGYYIYHVQSLLSPKFTREIFKFSDGGTAPLDWALCDDHDKRPIMTILSGVTGTSNDFYVRKCYEEAIKHQYSTVVVQSRGCSGFKQTSPTPFHCGLTDDYREVIQSIHGRFPKSPLLGLSFSMGANIMTKYIGEEGEQCPLTAGIIVGCPYDMYKVINHLDSQRFRFSRVYDMAILNFLKNAFKSNQSQILKIPVSMDAKKIAKSSGILEFTEEMTRKAFGYSSAKDLLDYSSCKNYMDDIKIPVLFLNSLDDPICIKTLIPFEKFLTNPNIVLALTEHGGHIGYMGGIWPTSWIEHPVIEFFESTLRHYNTLK